MTRDPYVWLDPWALAEEYEYAFERERDDHREAMGRMAEAHYYALRQVEARSEHLNKTAMDVINAQPFAPFIARTSGQ